MGFVWSCKHDRMWTGVGRFNLGTRTRSGRRYHRCATRRAYLKGISKACGGIGTARNLRDEATRLCSPYLSHFREAGGSTPHRTSVHNAGVSEAGVGEVAVLSGALMSDGEEVTAMGGISESEAENEPEPVYIHLDQRGRASLSVSPRQTRSERVVEAEEGGCDYVSQPDSFLPSSRNAKCLSPCLTKTRPSSGNASTTDPHKSPKKTPRLGLPRRTMTMTTILVRCPCQLIPRPMEVHARNEKVCSSSSRFLWSDL